MLPVITISRQYGSGGHEVGEKVAQKLNLPFYDKALIAMAAKKSGLSEEVFADADEKATSSLLYSMVMGSYAFGARVPGINEMPINDKLFVLQSDIIKKAAKEGPCVIIGRCADYILRERDDCFHVFVHADLGTRAQRIVRLYGESEKSPEKRLEEKDRKRRLYYRHYTDREWGMSQNYHLSLDSGLIGVEPCADLIVRLVRAL